MVSAYLQFLTRSMADRPDLLRPFTRADVERVEALLEGVESKLDEDLGDFELP